MTDPAPGGPPARSTGPELSRRLPLSRIGRGQDFIVEANEAECAALARRMGIIAISALRCSFAIQPGHGRQYVATGTLAADVTQTCVVSGEVFASRVGEDFRVLFVPAGSESEELDLEADDEVPYEGDIIDLGEATAEQLALCLDPFPRKPGVSLPPGIGREDE